MPFRHPFEGALDARSLATVTGESVVAGFGPGALALQRSILGAPYASQLGASREYAQLVRRLVDGAGIDHDGPHFFFRGQMPAFPTPRVDVGLGVLRPGMARLAGEVADVAITWLTPPRYVADVLRPALVAGARAAGRPHPPRITAIVPFALAEHDRDPVELALSSNLPHLSLPHYRSMLRTAGIEVNGVDLEQDAKELLNGSAFVYGDPEDILRIVQEYESVGVDELVVNVTGVANKYGPSVAVQELTTLLNNVLPKGAKPCPSDT